MPRHRADGRDSRRDVVEATAARLARRTALSTELSTPACCARHGLRHGNRLSARRAINPRHARGRSLPAEGMARTTGLNDILNPLLFPRRRLRVSTSDVPAVDHNGVILAAIELDDEIDVRPPEREMALLTSDSFDHHCASKTKSFLIMTIEQGHTPPITSRCKPKSLPATRTPSPWGTKGRNKVVSRVVPQVVTLAVDPVSTV